MFVYRFSASDYSPAIFIVYILYYSNTVIAFNLDRSFKQVLIGRQTSWPSSSNRRFSIWPSCSFAGFLFFHISFEQHWLHIVDFFLISMFFSKIRIRLRSAVMNLCRMFLKLLFVIKNLIAWLTLRHLVNMNNNLMLGQFFFVYQNHAADIASIGCNIHLSISHELCEIQFNNFHLCPFWFVVIYTYLLFWSSIASLSLSFGIEGFEWEAHTSWFADIVSVNLIWRYGQRINSFASTNRTYLNHPSSIESRATPKTGLTDLKKGNIVRVVVISSWISFWLQIVIIVTELWLNHIGYAHFQIAAFFRLRYICII